MSVIRIKKSKREPYVILDTTALNDTRLSFRAKGVHTYLMSKKDDWQVYVTQLEKESPREGREAISAALKELEKAGYITRTRRRGERGRMTGWDTIVYETPALAAQDRDATENGLAEVGSTEVGLSEVGSAELGSTELGFADTSNYGCKDVLTEVSIDKTSPPLSPSGESPTATVTKAAADAKTVLAHLNTLTGRRYTTVANIAARMHQGATLAQCLLVLDWWAGVKVPQSPDQAQYFDNETPFRKSKFDKYHAAAEAWDRDGRPAFQATAQQDTRLSGHGLSTLAAQERLFARRQARARHGSELPGLPQGVGDVE